MTQVRELDKHEWVQDLISIIHNKGENQQAYKEAWDEFFSN